MTTLIAEIKNEPIMMVVVRLHIFVLLLILSTGCTLVPSKIEKAPENPEQAVVFDIDGTLTPRPFAIFTVREGAASAARLFADKGFKIIYLSARIKPLQTGIPSWLDKHNFPKGKIHVPQTMADAYDHATFKKGVLDSYKQNGWDFVAAYGDSSTDFEAYAGAGLEKDHVFALQRVGKASCQPGIWIKCFSSWGQHMDNIIQMTQPKN